MTRLMISLLPFLGTCLATVLYLLDARRSRRRLEETLTRIFRLESEKRALSEVLSSAAIHVELTWTSPNFLKVEASHIPVQKQAH